MQPERTPPKPAPSLISSVVSSLAYLNFFYPGYRKILERVFWEDNLEYGPLYVEIGLWMIGGPNNQVAGSFINKALAGLMSKIWLIYCWY